MRLFWADGKSLEKGKIAVNKYQLYGSSSLRYETAILCFYSSHFQLLLCCEAERSQPQSVFIPRADGSQRQREGSFKVD